MQLNICIVHESILLARLPQIMVEGVLRTETGASILFDHFGRLFPNKVVCANLVSDFSELLVAKRDLEETKRRLSHAESLQTQANPSQQPAHSPLLYSEPGVSHDDLEGGFRDPTVPSLPPDPKGEKDCIVGPG